MATLKRLGDLERAVMDYLWDADGPRTVHEVRAALAIRRVLAYTTVMTVLHRLAGKGLVVEMRHDRAYRYAPAHGRDELVAGLMIDALDQVADRIDRQAALLRFVDRVGVEETEALRRALDWGADQRPDGGRVGGGAHRGTMRSEGIPCARS